MKTKLCIIVWVLVVVVVNCPIAWGDNSSVSKDTSTAKVSVLTLDEILNKIEARYNRPGFLAVFNQEAFIKAMDITDYASGKIFIKRPDRMRWEYEKPESQTIVTDGKQLWIYRPEDNQVMVGRAPAFFKGGKGAGFLADMKTIREKFIILMDLKVAQNHHILKLLPKEKMIDIDFINLWITKKTFDIAQIITYNTYGDETRIQLSGLTFTEKLDDALFIFKIPEGADVVRIDEANF